MQLSVEAVLKYYEVLWVTKFGRILRSFVGQSVGKRVRLMSHESKTTQKAQRPIKHHHLGDGAARPSSGVDLMNPCRLRGGRPCACLFRCRR
jgi:hypothetical protein